MKHHQSQKYYSIVLVLVSLIVITNSYSSFEESLENIKFGDGISYYTIAEAAPNLPTSQLIRKNLDAYLSYAVQDTTNRGVFVSYDGLPFHHAQRLVLPYIAGIIAHYLPISVHTSLQIVVFFLVFLLVFSVVKITQTVSSKPFSPVQFAVLITIFFCSPYILRYPLASPSMLNELGFTTGIAIILSGLSGTQRRWVVGGVMLATVSKQTALIALFPTVTWMLLDTSWSVRYSLRKRIINVSIIVLLVVVTFVGVAFLTTLFPTFTLANSHLFDLLRVLFSDNISNKLHLFMEFCLRGQFYFLPISLSFLTIGFIKVFVKPKQSLPTIKQVSWKHSRIFLLVLFIPALWVQPYLGGPFIVGQNITRLTIYALLPCCVVLGLLLQRYRLFETARFNTWTILLCVVLFLSSQHPIVSTVLPFVFSEFSKTDFVVIFLGSAFLLSATIGWFFLRQLTRVTS